MIDREVADEALLAATALLERDVGGETHAIGLYFRKEGNLYGVYQQQQDGALVWADQIDPSGFGSARRLASYLLRLSEASPEELDPTALNPTREALERGSD